MCTRVDLGAAAQAGKQRTDDGLERGRPGVAADPVDDEEAGGGSALLGAVRFFAVERARRGYVGYEGRILPRFRQDKRTNLSLAGAIVHKRRMFYAAQCVNWPGTRWRQARTDEEEQWNSGT